MGYSNITSTELETAVTEFKERFPCAGEAVVKGHLESVGIHVLKAKFRKLYGESVDTKVDQPHPSVGKLTQSQGQTPFGISMITIN